MKSLKFIALSIFMLHLSMTVVLAQMTTEEALSKFVAAGMAYQDGQYDTAIARYREILEGGKESGAVYYNLGNSYFRNGQIGKAILNYERAKQLIPRDSDLNYNYHYARARMDSPDHKGERGYLEKIAGSFAQFYSLDEMTLIITGLIFTVGFLFLASLYMGWPQSLRRNTIVFLVSVLAVYIIGLNVNVRQNKDLAIVVTAGESTFEPRTDSTVHFKLSEGMKIRMLEAEGKWIKIQRPDGKAGWASRDVLEKISFFR